MLRLMGRRDNGAACAFVAAQGGKTMHSEVSGSLSGIATAIWYVEVCQKSAIFAR